MAVKTGFLVLCAIVMMVGSTFPVFALDPLDGSDGKLDTDRDNLKNADEFAWGTDPNDPDSDGGGAYDGWEVYYETHRAVRKGTEVQLIDKAYHFDPNFAGDEGRRPDANHLIQVRDNDASATVTDPDQDGWNNLHEFLVGTDPTNPNTDDDKYKTDSADPDPLISNGVDDPPFHDDHPGGNGGGGSGEGEGFGTFMA